MSEPVKRRRGRPKKQPIQEVEVIWQENSSIDNQIEYVFNQMKTQDNYNKRVDLYCKIKTLVKEKEDAKKIIKKAKKLFYEIEKKVEKITVTPIDYNGTKYYIGENNSVYDVKTHNVLGEWNSDKQEIYFNEY